MLADTDSSSECEGVNSFADVLADLADDADLADIVHSDLPLRNKLEEFKGLIAKGSNIPQNLTCLAFLSREPQTLHDGRTMTRTELYKHAIAIDISYGPAYRGLAYTMYNSPRGGPEAETTLEDGTTWTVVDLCKRSLELAADSGKPSSLAAACNALGYVLGRTVEKKVEVLKRVWTQKELLAEAARYGPENPKYFYDLGYALATTECVEVPDRGRMTKRELFEEAVRVGRKYSDGYYGLGFVEKDTKKKQELFKRSIQLNPKNAKAYKGLAYTLRSSSERVELEGTMWSKCDLENHAKVLTQKQSAPSTLQQEETKKGPAQDVKEALKYKVEKETTEAGAWRVVSLCWGREEEKGEGVAIKVDHTVQDVKKEVEVLRSLSSHHNVVTVFASYSKDDTLHVVLEIPYPAETLRKHLDNTHREKAVGYLAGIVAGVAHIHRHGLVVRDITPDTVLLVPTWCGFTPKLVDFASHIAAGDVGYPEYVAPECKGKYITTQCNVYSIGRTAEDMLHNAEHPFVAKLVSESPSDRPALDEAQKLLRTLGE